MTGHELTSGPALRLVSELRCHFCARAVDLPQRGWKAGQAAYCTAHHALVGLDPWVIGQEGLDYAEWLHHMPVEALVRWPWRAVNELAGPLVPSRLTYIAAFPGGGKTSFLMHCLQYWLAEGKRVCFLPLESPVGEVYARLACLETGVSADEALSMRLAQRAADGDLEAQRQREALEAAYRGMRERRDLLERLQIIPLPTLTLAGFQKAVAVAHATEADLLVVDHVDHLEGDLEEQGRYRSDIELSNALQSAALQAAKELNIPVVLATQLNSSRAGGDRLAHYKPPATDWLFNKGKKEQMAANILGLSRLLSPAASSEWLAEVRAGTRPIDDVAMKQTMGVTGMKLRYGGALKEKTALLRYTADGITDIDLTERRDMQAARHRILLGSPSDRRLA